jgi:hypothetical protein
MISNRRIREAFIIVGCVLVVWVAGCGNGVGSQGNKAAPGTPSHAASTPETRVETTHSSPMITTNAAATFRVTSIEMFVTPTTTSTWKCGSYIQVVYNAVFHVVSGPTGGTIVFSYTLNNGRSQMPEKLTILPGQRQSNFVFTWQGSLPADHTYPGPGGVLVTSPNYMLSRMVSPSGGCR